MLWIRASREAIGPVSEPTHDKKIQRSMDAGSNVDGNMRYWSPQRRVALHFSAYSNRTGGHIINFAKNKVPLAACLVCIHISVNLVLTRRSPDLLNNKDLDCAISRVHPFSQLSYKRGAADHGSAVKCGGGYITNAS